MEFRVLNDGDEYAVFVNLSQEDVAEKFQEYYGQVGMELAICFDVDPDFALLTQKEQRSRVLAMLTALWLELADGSPAVQLSKGKARMRRWRPFLQGGLPGWGKRS